jgi:anti-anti-sigma factor
MASFEQQDVGGVRVLRLRGSLTQHDVDALEPSFDAALPDGSRAVVDLAGVDLITTPGLTLFISTTRRLLDSRGKVVFASARGGVLDVLRRCRLDEVLELVPGHAEALQIVKT